MDSFGSKVLNLVFLSTAAGRGEAYDSPTPQHISQTGIRVADTLPTPTPSSKKALGPGRSMWGVLLAATFIVDSLAAFSQLKSNTGAGRPYYTEILRIFYYIYEGYLAIIFPANRRQLLIKPESVWTNGKPLVKDESHDTLSAPSTPATRSLPVPESPSPALPAATVVVSSTNNLGPSRGLRKATASPPTYGQSSIPPLAAQARAESIPLTASVSASEPCAAYKALLFGFNYERCGKPGRRLRHAADDARRFAATLTKLGYSSQNIRVVTDETGQPFPSYEYMIECMDWLVQDASKGAKRFFVFSGHCDLPRGTNLEPSLVAADLMAIPRSTFQARLVAKVPAGAELTIVLDCCHAASMVKLKYCIGRMGYEREMTQTTKAEALSEAGKVIRAMPQSGSLHGLPVIGQKAPSLSLSAPVSFNQAPFGTPANMPQHRSRGVFAAGPLPLVVPNQVSAPGMFTSLAGKAVGMIGSSSPVNLPAGTNPRLSRQLVVQGLKEREDDFISPVGKVVMWAGTGERQKAFEVSTGAKNGIITAAICNALDTCPDKIVTQREVWHSVVGAVDKENDWRSKRDAKKAKKPPVSVRVQCAELWVSQAEPLSSSSSVLDQPVHGKLADVNP
ncbi:unnamed protein product [Rhizoctonia solani]|uniref:Peptidase C14 caspase domain-containing protein n=1 Tax=Rhizoctonia solani TaxID=456999 RepID=A0A8H3DJY2_9AGAM|nr:unnamed protein product [Rhizoctonia solani]